MPMAKKQLPVPDAKRDIGAELLQSVREMKAQDGKMAYQFNMPNSAIVEGLAQTEHVSLATNVTLRNTA
jgi:putative transcriptional regulator